MQEQLAAMLLDLGAVSLSPNAPYTWASGLKSPVYCDNRLVISDVSARRIVIQGFQSLYAGMEEKPDLIAGTATAGIPHAAWLAEAEARPMIYVRSSEKKHGRKNQIEGRLRTGQSVLLIEDLISTGGSSIKAAQAIHDQGGKVLCVASIFSYGFNVADQGFRDAGLAYQSLTGLDDLMQVAIRRNLISSEDIQTLHTWSKDPQAWSNAYIKANPQT